MKKLDLTNQQFGKLTAIKEIGRDRTNHVLWLCQCNCGNEITTTTSNLRSRKNKSCGCSKLDLLGQRFGRWSVKKKAGYDKRYAVLWLCECDCGNKKTVNSYNLRSGDSKSCGCLKKDITTKRNTTHGMSKTPEYRRTWQNNKRASDPSYKLNNNISRGIRSSLNGNKTMHWEGLVDYTLNELIKHLESLFITGMNWDNYGEWHIDHIIPKSVFNFTKPEHEDFKRCWALKNLQPLWAEENISKFNKLDKHFQPTLALG